MFHNLNRDSLIAILIIIIIAGAFLLSSGGFFEKIVTDDGKYTSVAAETKCCDTGDGNDCKPQTGEGQTITFNGQQYGLLKSKVKFVEGSYHLKDSKQTVTIDGKTYPIILNSSDTHKNFINTPPNTCDNSDTDKYLKGQPVSIFDPSIINLCTQISNDQIIFVCKDNCKPAPSCDNTLYQDPKLSCYGDSTTQYDTYFRLSDYNASSNTGVPDFIKNCDKKNLQIGSSKSGATPTLIFKNEDKKENLQLDTFKIAAGDIVVPWFSPFCKPAIYLYPPKETQVSVQVNPVGHFTYTNPIYPVNGWVVDAFPDGRIISNKAEFPYLYYEVDIPSILIEKPKEGFVASRNQIEEKLGEVLPKLGLNEKESSEMISYWTRSLPSSPYYFIGIIDRRNLDSLSSVSISPEPDKLIRVALYFEPLDSFEETEEPSISQVDRGKGFTAVEWGGVVKSSKPFTCLQ